MRRLISVLLAAAALALVVQACSSSSPPPVIPDGGTDGGTDGGSDGGPDGGADGGSCKLAGAICLGNGECCTTYCDGTGHCSTVVPGAGTCKVTGQACSPNGTDPINGCCSWNCAVALCAPATTCQVEGDVCHQDIDCCGMCCSADGANCGAAGGTGRCMSLHVPGAPNCQQSGTPCSGGSNCCSNACTDMGSGVKICQPASGCRIASEWCTSVNQCCNINDQVPPNKQVECSVPTGSTTGICTAPPACNPPGDPCGVTFTENCCNGGSLVCKYDSTGLKRCYGGCPNDNCSTCPTGYDPDDPACCIAAGGVCQFKDQCCNGLPCLPDPLDGKLKCTAPTCKPPGTPCSGAGDTSCCEGSCQSIEGGGYICLTAPPPPDGGPTCKANDLACTSGGECCSTYCLAAGDGGFTCQPPPLCQPQDGICLTNADCCSGLSCSIPAGQTSGLCKPGATCPAAGQTCSPTQACCPGLLCTDKGTSTLCTGTGICVCVFSG